MLGYDGYHDPNAIDNIDEYPDGRIEESDDDDDGNTKRTEDKLACLEVLALDFLSQLCRSRKSAAANSGTTESDTDRDVKDTPGRPKIQLQLVNRSKRTASGDFGMKCITYPRKCISGSAKPFGLERVFGALWQSQLIPHSPAQLFQVVNYMHEAVLEDTPATKRQLVDDIAASLDLERSDLNVRATAKGIFSGSGLRIDLVDGEAIYGSDSEASLVPVGEDVEAFSVDDDVAWVLLVEKDAVFQTLLHHRLTTSLAAGKGIVITGKGYPDMATRQLVKTLSDCLPKRIPIVALVDGDPFGIDILSVYKYGSRALSHENSKLAASRVKWLGLWSTELSSLGIDKDALIPITAYDEKKALSLLRNKMPSKWRRELNHMLHNRRKAEIEILSTVRSFPIPPTPDSSNQCVFEASDDDSVASSPISSCPLASSDQPPLKTAVSPSERSPLMQYVIPKLREFVASASRL